MRAARLLRRERRAGPPPEGPLWVELAADQPHPVDLRWADELVARTRPRLRVRPEDELLILVPNRPIKVNAGALRVLGAMVDEGKTVAEVLAREGDGPQQRRDLHYFFSDLRSWLSGTLGEGQGRRAVAVEPFSAPFSSYPVLAEVALTYRCNLSCAFCYAGCPSESVLQGVMSEEDVRIVLGRIWHEALCPSVSFTGGEPTLHPGLPGLVEHARSLGLAVNLISNGQLLDERLVGELADAGLASAQLSLEGATAGIHDGLVGRTGAFSDLWEAVNRLRKRGVRVHTNTTLTRRNVRELGAIVDRVAESGLERLTMNLMIPCGSARAAVGELLVPYAEAGQWVRAAVARARERGIELVWYSPLPLCLFNTIAEGLGNRGCAAAEGLLHVSPTGDVLPCSSFRPGESLGNLVRQPFAEIWQSAAARFFREKRMIPPLCEPCPDRAACQGACCLYWREVGLAEIGGTPED